MLAMLLCVAASCFAAEERSTKDIFADSTIADVVITGDQLRVRTHPDLDGYIIKKLDKGTVCKFMNKICNHQRIYEKDVHEKIYR